MPEKVRARYQTRAEPMLESGERVDLGVTNQTVPASAYLLLGGGILLLPYAIQHNSIVVLTQKHIYVLKVQLFGKATKVLLKTPYGSVSAEVGGSPTIGLHLKIGDQKLWLPYGKRVREWARAIAIAASELDGPPAPGEEWE